MKYSDFEKHIGTELSGAKETVDITQLLQGLDLNDLPRKRKGRPFLFWMLIPIILIGSYATFVAMDGNQSFSANQNSQQSNNELKTNQDLTINSNQTDSNNTIDDMQSLSNEVAKNVDNESLNKEIASSLASQNEVNSSINASRILNKKTDDSRVILDTEESSDKSEYKTKLSTPIKTIEYFSNSSFSEQSNFIDSRQGEFLEADNNQKLSYYKPTINKETVSIARANVDLPYISSRSFNIAGIEAESDDLFSRMKINCPSFNQAHWRLALIPEIGIFTPFKTLVNKNQENTQAFEERQRYEETLEGLNLGLYTMLVRDKLPVYVKAGISYSRITERTDLEYNYTLPDTTIGVISQTVSANGDSITTIMGPIISEKIFTGKNRQHNYIHLFDLPVSVGYNAYIAGFDIGIEAGVKINLMTRATGNLLTSRSEYTNLSLNSYYKKRIGLSYFGGIMIGRNFGRLGDFYIAPRFTYYPTDFSNNINEISQKYVTMGLNVGYVYKLK